MAGDAVRQRYALATGKGLASSDTSSKVLKYARGGKVVRRPGDDKFTSITQKKVAPGFKVHRP